MVSFLFPLGKFASDKMYQLVFGFLESDGQEPEVGVNGVDREGVLALVRDVRVLGRRGGSHLQQTLVTRPKSLTQPLPQPRVLLQRPHEKELVAVQDVLPIPDGVGDVERLGPVPGREDTVALLCLYEGLRGQGRLQDLINVNTQSSPSSTLLIPGHPESESEMVRSVT